MNCMQKQASTAEDEPDGAAGSMLPGNDGRLGATTSPMPHLSPQTLTEAELV